MALTPEEKLEFTALKYARAEQGFFTPTQKARYSQLWYINAKGFQVGMNAFLLEQKQIELN